MTTIRALLLEEEKRRAAENPPGEHTGWAPFIPPMVDVFFDDVVYVWGRFMQTGYRGDFELELYDGASIGEMPEWFSDYSEWIDNLVDGYRLGLSTMTFALEHGIAPGQPFLLEVGPPHSYKCSWEYDEWDTEYSIELVRVIPRDAKKAARSWSRALEIQQRCEAAWQDHLTKKRHLEQLKKENHHGT